MKKKDEITIYLWFDTEFTSLELEQAQLLQVALIITDTKLNRLLSPDQDLNLIVKLEDGKEVSPWVAENLPDLVVACQSSRAFDVMDVDTRLTSYLDEAIGLFQKDVECQPVLAGNSVHADLSTAQKFLPKFSGRFHYRLFDVSTLKQEWKHWFSGEEFDKDSPDLVKKYFPESKDEVEGRAHDAYYDILASMAELNFYCSQLKKI